MVLEYVDMLIVDIFLCMGLLIIMLLQKYGESWIYVLVINDFYFDFMGLVLVFVGIFVVDGL